MPREPYSKKESYRAREQFNDYLSDLFAPIHKDQKVFYVGSTNGNSAYSGRRISAQKATIAQGVTLQTASRGDVLLIDPFHAETTTAVIVPVAGSAIKGVKIGNKRPAITLNGAVDMFSFTAANAEITGLECTIATTDAATAIVNFAAARCRVSDLKIIPSATSVNVVDVFTFATGGDHALVENIDCRNSVVAVNSFINFEAAVVRPEIRDSFFFGDAATAGVIDAAVVVSQLHFRNVTVATIGSTIPAVILDGNPTGLMEYCYFAGTSTTLADNFQPGNLLRLNQCYVSEETDASKQGAIIPAVDAD